MNPHKNTMVVSGQIIKLIPPKLIEKLKNKHNIQTRSFTATSHVVSLIHAQLAHALSLNDICDGMRNHHGALSLNDICDGMRNHHGVLSQIRNCVPPSRNGLSHANKIRTADMAEELFWTVYNNLKDDHPAFFRTSRAYPGLPRRFKRTIHTVDSSTISLVAKCMDWAKHRSQKAAAKIHMDLELGSFLPSFAAVNRAKDSDPKMAWEVCAHIRAGEIVTFDKAYIATSNTMTGPKTSKNYPGEIRMVVTDVLIDKKWKRMSFLTNNFTWAASSICELYRSRWGVEVFFKGNQANIATC